MVFCFKFPYYLETINLKMTINKLRISLIFACEQLLFFTNFFHFKKLKGFIWLVITQFIRTHIGLFMQLF